MIARNLQTGSGCIDQEQADVRRVPGFAIDARDNDDPVGHVPVEHESLAAVERESAVSGNSHGLDAFGIVRELFVKREGEQQFAGDDPGQQFRLLRFAARFQDRVRTQQNRGDQRRIHQRAARLLKHQAKTGMAEPITAVCLRDRHAGPAEFDHLSPQVAIKAFGVPAVAQFSMQGKRRLLAAESAGRLAQQLLFFVQQ